MEQLLKQVNFLINEELDRANKKHGNLASAHEGYAVILEEKEEAEEAMLTMRGWLADFWTAVKKDDLESALRFCAMAESSAMLAAGEIIQTAAMARKIRNAIKGKTEGKEG